MKKTLKRFAFENYLRVIGYKVSKFKNGGFEFHYNVSTKDGLSQCFLTEEYIHHLDLKKLVNYIKMNINNFHSYNQDVQRNSHYFKKRWYW